MAIDRFSIVAEAWRIISQHKDPRLSARELCRMLAEALGATTVELEYRNTDSYTWNEKAQRVGAPSSATLWTVDFPSGKSQWRIEGGLSSVEETGPLIELISALWLRNRETTEPVLAKTPPEIGAVPVNPQWIAVSRLSRIVASRLGHLSHSSKPLLLIGDSGSGKTYIARLLHQSGPDPSAPFVGPGFSGERGTLYVPNWGEIPARDRSLLLKDKRRLIAAVIPGEGADALRQAWNLKTGGSGLTMKLPALRDRLEDLPLLAGHFLETAAALAGRPAPELSTTALEALRSYPWPGSTRELEETMARTLSSLPESAFRVGVGDFPPGIRGAIRKAPEPSFPERLVALEYEALKEELRRQRGNMTRTAEALGLTPRQVSWRVRKYGIDPREFKPRYRNSHL